MEIESTYLNQWLYLISSSYTIKLLVLLPVLLCLYQYSAAFYDINNNAKKKRR